MHLCRPAALFLLLLPALAPAARAVSSQEAEFFEKSVRPVLAEHCIKCHGPDKQKAELRLDSRAAILKGGDDGPAAEPGKPDESSLVKSIRHEGDSKMPEKEPKLPDQEISALTEWVRMGMPWPEGEPIKTSAQQEAASRHWSFQPIADPAPPVVQDAAHWGQSDLDRFVLAKLEAAGLAPAPRADKRTLLRRATFDLTGLPPTLAEVEAFEKDMSPAAFEHVVDRLLASPRYGERWGRYWLDVARYADTKGYLVANEERRFPYSYTYRDWVIRALNEDLPYDAFLTEQIAADRATAEKDPSSAAALGFLTLGRRFLNNQADIIDDRIDVVCRGTMALTVGCARCHDHKFDPISQKDYYALYGVFQSSVEPKDLPPLPDTRNAEDAAEYDRQLNGHKAEIVSYKEKKAEEASWLLSLSLGSPTAVPSALIERAFNRADREELVKLRNKITALDAGPLSPPRAMALADAPQPSTPHVFIRGNPGRPGEEVPRRFLTVLSGGAPKPFPNNGSGRLELAQAIASKSNPLTARVFVNRVWLHHFGQGLVRTPSDFGVKGELPTHPEMLDWLASRFMANGWSLKQLHRLILLSSVYQQGSDVSAEAARLDPEDRLLSRMSRQRLDFEAMRDSLLFVAGQLDLKMGGRSVELMKPPFAVRRAVYGFIDRQNLPGTFRTFDFATPDSTSPQPHVTTVPQQALFMMNSPFVMEEARSLATTAATVPESALAGGVQALYERVYARPAEDAEVAAGVRFLQAQAQLAAKPDAPRWQNGWGFYDEKTGRVEFHPFEHWTGKNWQQGEKLPDPECGFAMLNTRVGHPGRDARHAVIRRWTAPEDGVVRVSGTLRRPNEQGDGVLARIVSSGGGEAAHFVAEPKATSIETACEGIAVKAGDTLDFLVECRAEDSFDTFEWAPVVHAGSESWSAEAGFSGPAEKPRALTAWEKYAQVLLASNEFVFVD